MPELTPIILAVLVVVGFGIYVARAEIASRRRFPDDQHEHGRNPL